MTTREAPSPSPTQGLLDPHGPVSGSGENDAVPPEGAGVGQATRPATPDLQTIALALRAVTWREPKAAWRQVVEIVGVTKLVIGAALVALVVAAFLLPGGERSDPFDGAGGAMDLVIKLGAVLALAYVSMAALKRYTAAHASQRGTLLQVLDTTTLGPHRAVYVVRAGQKRLVLGVTQHQITPLAELDDDPTVTVTAPGTTIGQ